MPRTTAVLVQSILAGTARQSLVPFIGMANNLVTRLCVSVGYSDETLEYIERLIAAHFYTVVRRRPVDEWVGQARNRYEDKVDFGLMLTWYGQQALVMDTEGTLVDAKTQKVMVGITWLGAGEYERTTEEG